MYNYVCACQSVCGYLLPAQTRGKIASSLELRLLVLPVLEKTTEGYLKNA